MAFENDILIIYADNDNSGKWVSNFKKFLELMLVQVSGEKPNIVLKSENDGIAVTDLTKAAIFIPVLSPAFINSGVCLDSVEAFFKNIKKTEDNRVFKIYKNPFESDEEPEKLRPLIGYDLFHTDIESGLTEDFTDFFTTEAEMNFWMKIVDLAYDIHDTLIKLKGSGKKTETKPIYDRRTIYLAETGRDLTVQRNIIKRELQRYGYKVLPDHTLPHAESTLRKTVEKEIEESNLSIHLIGNSYGEIPEGANKSTVDIQNQIAAEKSMATKEKGNFSRLIWISPNLQSASERQLSFIENLKRDMASSEGTEILQTPLEDFKNIMRDELIEASTASKLHKKSPENRDGKKPLIYILYDKVDQKGFEPIKKFIEKSGYEVLEPLQKGDLLELRQHHIVNLRNLDAALIFQENVNDQWVKMKLLDLLKAPGFGRRKPIKGKAIISNKKDKLDISAYKSHNITLIDGDKKGALDFLKAFLEELKD